MTAPTRLTRLALACALALATTQAAAAVRMSEAFDGAWFNPAQDGRGVLVDWMPNAQRAGGTLFATTFIYDNAGNPFWLTLQDTWSEFQFTSNTVGIFRAAAGTWANPAALSNQRIGTATFTVNHCNQIVIALDMDAATGLADQTLTLRRVVPSGEESCVYDEAFTACPSFATAAPAFGTRACLLPATLTGDQTLGNHITWVMNGKVQVGRDTGQPGGAAAELEIEPGTLLVSTGQAGSFDHLAVNRGSKIYAEGTDDFPIIMTTSNELPGATTPPAPGQVGGFVIYGNAPANCFPNCLAEWEPGTPSPYGGADTPANREDSSGEVRFMQVRFAGFVFATGRELNSFTFSGVGRGTTLEYLQAFRGQDDAFEWFGGTVNLRNAVVTCPGDDGFDWDEGWVGKVQFGVVEMRGCPGSNHGFELSNSPTNADATPRSRGTVANVTILGDSASATSDALQLNSGTAGNFYNLLLVNTRRSCVQIAGAATQAQASAGNLTLQGSRLFCATPATDGTGTTAGFTAGWINTANAGNAVLTSNPLRPGSFLPNGDAPRATFPPAGATAPGLGDWFEATDYVGAFRSDKPSDNWTLGWARPFNP